MRSTRPTIEQIDELPALYRKVIPTEWKDLNGHLNIAYYMHLYNDAAAPLYKAWGVDHVAAAQQGWGIFDLEHHVWYWRKVHANDIVSLHCRLVGHNAKRFHGVMFIVNRSSNEIASALEFVSTGADLRIRSSSPLPADAAQSIAIMTVRHNAMAWRCPMSGSISI